MSILSKTPQKRGGWDENSYNDLLRNSPEHSKTYEMWTQLSRVLNLVLQIPLDSILHLPVFDEGRGLG